jgi:hypothetical protein
MVGAAQEAHRLRLSVFGIPLLHRLARVNPCRNFLRVRDGFRDGAFQRRDILLLDEPTNHLDLGGIEWLESVLANAPFAYVE